MKETISRGEKGQLGDLLSREFFSYFCSPVASIACDS
jgi:hypothetical protein